MLKLTNLKDKQTFILSWIIIVLAILIGLVAMGKGYEAGYEQGKLVNQQVTTERVDK